MALRTTLVLSATALSLALSTAAFATDAAPAAKAEAKVEAPAAAKVETKSAELKDGTKIEITGDVVEVIGKDGKKSPAPDAEHTLKDGTKVTTKGGKIVK